MENNLSTSEFKKILRTFYKSLDYDWVKGPITDDNIMFYVAKEGKNSAVEKYYQQEISKQIERSNKYHEMYIKWENISCEIYERSDNNKFTKRIKKIDDKMCKIEDNITGYNDYLQYQFKAEVMYYIEGII
jgi:hypothetical protein